VNTEVARPARFPVQRSKICNAQQREEERRYQYFATETSHWIGFVNLTSFRTACISYLREVLLLHPKSKPKPAQGMSRTLQLEMQIRQTGSSLKVLPFHVHGPHMLRNNGNLFSPCYPCGEPSDTASWKHAGKNRNVKPSNQLPTFLKM
jgi:hypothetical protein